MRMRGLKKAIAWLAIPAVLVVTVPAYGADTFHASASSTNHVYGHGSSQMRQSHSGPNWYLGPLVPFQHLGGSVPTYYHGAASGGGPVSELPVQSLFAGPPPVYSGPPPIVWFGKNFKGI